jgi:carbonic anhydrase
MSDEILRTLLDRNQSHTDALAEDHFAYVQDGQAPPVVSVCCSDSRVSQEGMFDVEEAGYLFSPSNIGNQVRDEYQGDLVIDGNLMYPILHAGTESVAIVGHTQCGAVTAAYQSVTGEGHPEHPGIRERVEKLVPFVEDGLDSDAVDADVEEAALIDQLVEYNVDRQVETLRGHDGLPGDVSVYGFVYDFHERYGDVPGRTYVVNVVGETDPEKIRDELPNRYGGFVDSLLAE